MDFWGHAHPDLDINALVHTPYGIGRRVPWGPTRYAWPHRAGFRFYVLSKPHMAPHFEETYLTKAGARSGASALYRSLSVAARHAHDLVGRPARDRNEYFLDLVVVHPHAFDQQGNPVKTHDPLTGQRLPNFNPPYQA